MKKTIFILSVLFSFLIYSCENENQIIENVSENISEKSTRSFEYYITGPSTVYEGETVYYSLDGIANCENSNWSCTNGEVIMSGDSYGIIFFENPGNGKITVNALETERYTYITKHLTVKVLPFDSEVFINDLTIIGPKEPEIGQKVTYKLSSNYSEYVLDEITWTLDNVIMSGAQTFVHTFIKEKAYFLKCTGSFSKLSGGGPITFEKQLIIYPGGMKIYGPNTISDMEETEYSLPFVPENATVRWWVYGARCLDITSTSNQRIKVKRRLKVENSCTIYAEISHSSGTKEKYSVNIQLPNLFPPDFKPELKIIGPTNVYGESEFYLDPHLLPEPVDRDYTWEILPTNYPAMVYRYVGSSTSIKVKLVYDSTIRINMKYTIIATNRSGGLNMEDKLYVEVERGCKLVPIYPTSQWDY